MQNMEDHIYFGPLQRDNMQQILAVIIDANCNSHPMILSKVQSIQEFSKETQQMINEYFDEQQRENLLTGRNGKRVFGATMQGKLIAVVMSIDAATVYAPWKKIAEDTTNPLCMFYTLFASLYLDGLKRGVASYHGRMSVLSEISKKGIASRLHYEFCKYELSQGYEYSLHCTMVDDSPWILMKNGSEQIRKAEYSVDNVIYKQRIFKSDFRKVIKTYQQRKPKAKL